jgi:RNA polymerase sigma-70 factor, ECF subfamily
MVKKPIGADNTSDEQIVEQVISGDIEAYGDLMSRYEEKLLRYVIFLARDQIFAKDIVQDTFIKAYTNLRSYKSSYKFSSWIYRIAHNETMNAIKRNNHTRNDVDLDSSAEVETSDDTIRKIDSKILQGRIHGCLQKLATKYREVLMLQYYENMKYEDIADVLQIPKSTVGVRCSRAKDKLKKICESEGVKYE